MMIFEEKKKTALDLRVNYMKLYKYTFSAPISWIFSFFMHFNTETVKVQWKKALVLV